MHEELTCPICGSEPVIRNLLGLSSETRSFKVFCSGNGLHISCGDWKSTETAAWKDWELRRTGFGQPECYHPTNREMISQKVSQSKEAESFLKVILASAEILSDQTDPVAYLENRYDYGFCQGCEYFGNKYCICQNKVK